MLLIQTVHLSACLPPLYPLKGLRQSSVKSLFLCLYTCFHMCRTACLLCSQDLAEHLVTHGHRLTAADHKELSSLFNLGQESHRFTADRHVALAMANLNIPQNWNVLGSHSGNGEWRFSTAYIINDIVLLTEQINNLQFERTVTEGCFQMQVRFINLIQKHEIQQHLSSPHLSLPFKLGDNPNTGKLFSSLMASFLFSMLTGQKSEANTVSCEHCLNSSRPIRQHVMWLINLSIWK